MSVEIRDCIVVMIIDSCRVTKAAEAYDQPVCTVCYPYKKYLQTGTAQDRPCSRRLLVLSVNHKRIIYWKAHAALKIEYSCKGLTLRVVARNDFR
jgi:hypothetical protein